MPESSFTYLKKGLIIILVFIIQMQICCYAQEKGVDTIIFKADATLPSGINSREIKCLILEDSNETVRADISLFSGIKDVRQFPKQSIQEIIVADRIILELKKVEAYAKLPPVSYEAPIYENLLKDKVQPFLTKYAGTPAAAQMELLAQAVRRESYLVNLGWGRVADQWLLPDEMENYRDEVILESLMTELKTTQIKVKAGDYSSLAGLAPRVSSLKNNIYYPYLINGLKSVAGPAGQAVPLDLQNLLDQSIQRLMEAASTFEMAKQAVEEIQNKQIEDPEVLINPLKNLVSVVLTWPELKQLVRFLIKNNRYFLDAQWASSFQSYTEAQPTVYSQLANSWMAILETQAMPMTLRLASKKEALQIKDFQIKTCELIKSQSYSELAQLSIPEGFILNEKLTSEFAKIGAFAQNKMATANSSLKKGRAAYEANLFLEAANHWKESSQTWSKNPDLLLCKDELLDLIPKLIEQRKKAEANQLLVLLKQVWPNDEKVAVIDANLAYFKSFLTTFDNYTYGMLGFIAICAVAGFFIVRFIVRAISA